MEGSGCLYGSASFLFYDDTDPSAGLTRDVDFAGLGNPGKQYQNNRHNIGFMVIDEIARQNSLPDFRSKFEGELTEGRVAGEKVKFWSNPRPI